MKKTSIFLIIFLVSFNCYSQYNDNLYVIEKNNKKGYVDNNLNIVIEPIYDDLNGFRQKFWGNHSIVKSNNKYGVIDINGKQILPFVYDRLDNTESPNKFIFKKDDKYGLLNINGQEILKPEFGYGTKVINQGKNFIVKKEKKYFLLNKKGKKITKNGYDYLDGKYNSKICIFKINGKYGYLNSKGKVIIKQKFKQVDNFKGNYAVVKVDGKFGIINKKGTTLIKPIYDRISYQYSFFSNYQFKDSKKVYYLNKNRKTGLLDENLKIIAPVIYDEIGDFNEGYAYVKKDEKYGFINKNGEIIIPLEYEDADSFSEGLAPVIRNGSWGYINNKNNVIIDFKFNGRVEPFFNGMAVYAKRNFKSSKGHYVNDKCGFIDINGDIVIDNIYRNAKRFNNGVAIVDDSNSEYLINKKNEKIVLKHSESIEIEESE